MSPRERKIIKSLAAMNVHLEEWITYKEGMWKKYQQTTEYIKEELL